MIHGGPHGQQGPGFAAKAQVYAAQGWAALMVNYRGSTGYGQALADKIFGDQNGGEAADVLAGVDAALARYPWIDARPPRHRGHQLRRPADQLDHHPDRSLQGGDSQRRHQQPGELQLHGLLPRLSGRGVRVVSAREGPDGRLWERSPIRLVAQDHDPDAHHRTARTTTTCRSPKPSSSTSRSTTSACRRCSCAIPREGHGLRETAHVVDHLERSLAWYRKYFGAAADERRWIFRDPGPGPRDPLE